MKITTVLAATGLAIVALASGPTSIAGTQAQINSGVSETLVNFNALNPGNKAPGDKAAGVLVFPRVTKGGVGVGGEFGEGALQVNGKTVGYYSVGSGSVGLTLGLAQQVRSSCS